MSSIKPSKPAITRGRAGVQSRRSLASRARSFVVRFFRDGHLVLIAGRRMDVRVPFVMGVAALLAVGASMVVEHGLPSIFTRVPEVEVSAAASAGRPCPGPDLIKQFVGVDINAAVTLATAHDLVLRIRQEDGLALSASEEVDTRRINVDVENGKTIAAECG